MWTSEMNNIASLLWFMIKITYPIVLHNLVFNFKLCKKTDDFCFRVCSVTFTDDTSMLAAGFEDSTVKVWTLSQQKLRAMKPGDTLADLDKESGKVRISHIKLIGTL